MSTTEYWRQRKVLVLNARDFEERISHFDELHERQGSSVPRLEVIQEMPAPESVDPHKYWLSLASQIAARYHDFYGFVIMQSVSTMVSTACMLSFLLENLGKPVVLTGAVGKAELPLSDWRRNFVLATLFAGGSLTGGEDCCEVAIVFAEQVLRGNRCILESSTRLQPFSSPHFPPLASMQGKTMLAATEKFLPAPTGRLVAHTDVKLPDVVILTLSPSLRPEAVQLLVERTQAKALVIVAYGAGNIPVRDRSVLEAAKAAHDRGLIVIVCSQVRKGLVDLGVYYTSGEIAQFAVGARDMTLEATVAKLKYLIGCEEFTNTEIEHLLTRSLRGELTEAGSRSRL